MSVSFQPQVDTHVHSIASGHAYSTIEEIARAAQAKGLRGVAITDHGPGLPGGPHFYHFMALRFVPRFIGTVRVLRGVEANILNDGHLDLEDHVLERLDIVLAGFHEDCAYDGTSCADHTRTLLRAMEHPHVDIISHPGNPQFPIDYAAVVEQAVRTGTALEINSSSFTISRRNSAPNCLEIARLAARLGAPVAIGSDAHISMGVGKFREALRALEQCGVAVEQVVNRTLESTVAFLQRNGRVVPLTEED
ncbi:MAG: phosphatase [Desulfuromonadaceae bacterium]|nr:phosphatase [Desulfuromonadaceae bacterium]